MHVPMNGGTKHSTATDGIRRGLSLEQIQAALRDADPASMRVDAKLARGGSFDILRNPARVSHLYPAGNHHETTSRIKNLWRGAWVPNPGGPSPIPRNREGFWCAHRAHGVLMPQETQDAARV